MEDFLIDDGKNKIEGLNKTEINAALNSKADKENTYTKNEIDNALNDKMDKANPTGIGRIAVGNNVVASGSASQAFGASSTASGNVSHAEGIQTVASGIFSHAEGYQTNASGEASHAEGYQTIANGRYQHVSGKHNIVDNNNTYAEIIGNGTGSNKSNARTLDWQGNETLAGDLTINGNKSITSEITRLDQRITDLPEAMVIKGTLGVNGTIQELPIATAQNEGWTYKCITAGIYSGLTLKIGDTVTCYNPEGTSIFEWFISGYGDTDTDTWRPVKINGSEVLGVGISGGSVDFSDGENIKPNFDDQNNKISFSLDGVYTSAEVDNIVYNILPDGTASGTTANFNTSLQLPIKSMQTDVNAVQEAGTPTPSSPKVISGWSEIKLVHCGTNLFNGESEQGSYDSTTGAKISSTNLRRNISPISVKPNTTYKRIFDTSLGVRIFYYDKNMHFINSETSSNQIITFTTPLNCGFVNIAFQNAVTGLAILYPSSLNNFESYNGTTTLINLGGTYYGGHFTQDKAGHRQFDDTVSNLVNLPDLTFNPTTKGGHTCFYADLPNGVIKSGGEQAFEGKCSTYTVTSDRNLPNDLSCVFYCSESYGGYTRILIRDDSASAMTGAEFTDYVTGQITYEKANPQIIILPDGEPINTFNGINNFFADSGDITVTFKQSVNDAINAALNAANNSRTLGAVNTAKNGKIEEEKIEEVEEPKEETKK